MQFAQLVETLAETVHEANRALCESDGDTSQTPWAQTSEDNKQTSREGVTRILSNPLLSAADIHQEWVDGKKAKGWKHGDKKCDKAKTHPSMVTYDKLPQIEKHKDQMFREVVQKGALSYLAEMSKRVASRYAMPIRVANRHVNR